MKSWLTLWRREVSGFLLAPAFYLLLALFMILTGLTFWLLLEPLTEGRAAMSLVQDFFSSLLFFQLLLIPMLTMRSLAEEKRSGTIETLLTAPVSDAAVVLAKYAGSMTMLALLLLPTTAYLLLLRRLDGQGAMDLSMVWSGYTGLLVIGAMYVALGCWASAWARSPWMAAVTSFALIFMIYLAGYWPDWARHPTAQEIGSWIASAGHIRDFARGMLDSRPVVFHLGGAAWLLHAGVRAVESRKWK